MSRMRIEYLKKEYKALMTRYYSGRLSSFDKERLPFLASTYKRICEIEQDRQSSRLIVLPPPEQQAAKCAQILAKLLMAAANWDCVKFDLLLDSFLAYPFAVRKKLIDECTDTTVSLDYHRASIK